MANTRRLSLTLLLVAPLMAAQEMANNRPHRYEEVDHSVSEESEEHEYVPDRHLYLDNDGDTGDDRGVISDNHSWSRERRDLGTPGEDMETAEQLYFRPMFRHRQIVEERLLRQRLRDELKKQKAFTGSITPQSSTPAQRKYVKTASFTQYPSKPKKAAFRATVDGAVFRSQRSVHPTPYYSWG